MENRENTARGKQIFAKTVRVLTTAPLMALVTLSVCFVLRPDAFRGTADFVMAAVFLCLLPISAYPLQPVVPGFRGKGREGQRNLAIVMAVAGYIAGIVYATVFRVPAGLWVIFLTYFISGIGIVLFNKALKIRASGHACGVAGPIVLLVSNIGPAALWGLPVLALVFYVSIVMKRHTFWQLVWGCVISVAAFFFSSGIVALSGA